MPVAALLSRSAATATVEPSAEIAIATPSASPASVFEALTYDSRLLVQVASQPSQLMVLPSSHASVPVSTPLPHAVTVQLLSQPSPLTWLPSSHASFAAFSPLPHALAVQLLSQPSPLTR